DLTKKIRTAVSIRIEGRAVGVIEGGLLDHQLREVEVECLALDVPEPFAVDVTEMQIGDSLHVSDIMASVPANVTVLTKLERAVVAVHAPRVVEEETAAELEEDEEGVEGEEDAPADGETEDGEKAEGEGGEA
ncbi:MAG: hypothetical protein QGG73_08660, partial [Candidatus Hydrogenedentes bacterium]|nr:hypothetical protein [Candidatus Hydrogenedentota bacterium]